MIKDKDESKCPLSTFSHGNIDKCSKMRIESILFIKKCIHTTICVILIFKGESIRMDYNLFHAMRKYIL